MRLLLSRTDALTRSRCERTIARVGRWREQIERGFVFGFSAAVGASLAIVLLSLLLLLVLRPWG